MREDAGLYVEWGESANHEGLVQDCFILLDIGNDVRSVKVENAA
jgi:hypothetical protein